MFGRKKMKKYFTLLLMLSLALATVGLYAKSQSELNTFNISPNPMTKTTTISLSFITPVDINVYIEDAGGTMIKSLYSGHVRSDISLNWSRETDIGDSAVDGEYTVVVAYQGRYTSTKKTLILK